jgi:hypothetical protein
MAQTTLYRWNNDIKQWLEANTEQIAVGDCIRILNEDGVVYTRPDTKDCIFVVIHTNPFILYNDLSLTFMMVKDVLQSFEKAKLTNDDTDRSIMEVLTHKRNPTQFEYTLLTTWVTQFYSDYQLMYA